MNKGKIMRTPISRLIRKSILQTLSLGLLNSLIIAAPLLSAEEHARGHQASSSAKLVQLVREGTKQYIDVNNATAAGYGPFLGCVAGTDHGAMGVHYVNGALLGNLTLDPAQPEALIYEPSGGKMRLVGVEFILDSATWLAANNNTPPVLEGHVFNFVAAPNQFSDRCLRRIRWICERAGARSTHSFATYAMCVAPAGTGRFRTLAG
jgi:hypothetical protein